MADNEKKSFILYHNYYDYISKLTVEERGNLLTAIFEYQINGKVTTEISPMADMVFTFIEAQFERDNAKYLKICERNQKNGEKGGRPRKNQETQENPENPVGYLGFKKNPEKTQENPKNPIYDNGYMIYDNNLSPPKSPSTKGTCSPKANDTAQENRFELFWKEYPRKQAKKNALKAWLKIAPDEELTERIISAIKTQRLWPDWQKEGGRFIPLAATWLNGSRWEDEAPDSLQRSSIDVSQDAYAFMFDT